MKIYTLDLHHLRDKVLEEMMSADILALSPEQIIISTLMETPQDKPITQHFDQLVVSEVAHVMNGVFGHSNGLDNISHVQALGETGVFIIEEYD